MYRIIFPLPYQQATLPHPLSLREGAGGGARDRAGQENSSGLPPAGILLPPRNPPGNTPSAASGGTVSPAGSGPAPQWGASRTDRSESGDRRWTVATGDHRPPKGEAESHLSVRSVRGRAPPALAHPSLREVSRLRVTEGVALQNSPSPKRYIISSWFLPHGGSKGGWSRLPPRSAMDGRHWRPSPPFEMRCIE